MENRWSRLAAYALCRDDDGRVLLARVSSHLPADAGRWTMPGGQVEWGEHPDDAVRRELDEETGLVGRVDRVIAVWSQVRPAEITASGHPGHMVGIVYDVTVVGGELRDEADGTTDRAAWFTVDEARALPHVDQVDFCLDLVD